jgi:hypothetical protein
MARLRDGMAATASRVSDSLTYAYNSALLAVGGSDATSGSTSQAKKKPRRAVSSVSDRTLRRGQKHLAVRPSSIFLLPRATLASGH